MVALNCFWMVFIRIRLNLKKCIIDLIHTAAILPQHHARGSNGCLDDLMLLCLRLQGKGK